MVFFKSDDTVSSVSTNTVVSEAAGCQRKHKRASSSVSFSNLTALLPAPVVDIRFEPALSKWKRKFVREHQRSARRLVYVF